MPFHIGLPLAHHRVNIVKQFGKIATRLHVHLFCEEAFHGLEGLQTLSNHLERICDLFEIQREALETGRQPLLGIAVDA